MTIVRVTRLCARLVVVVLSSFAAFNGTAAYSAPASSNTIIVTTSVELASALSPINAGRRILVRAGTYEVSASLSVPDRASLFGEGVMLFDSSGLPSGFESTGRTVIRSTAALVGDVLTLGNGASLRGLAIEDVVRGGPTAGNVVAVFSRSAGDWVAASIDECEVITPNPAGVALQGPSGRGVLVVSRNLNLASAPPPHEGSVLSLHMRHSIIRAPGGGSGVFAINFASSSRISLFLDQNVIGGGLDTSGGVSRPDSVTEASVAIESTRNLYRSDSPQPTLVGWRISGGSDAPAPGLIAGATSANKMRVGSIDDRIEGFAQGVVAAGAGRAGPLAQPSSLNSADLNLVRLRIRTTVSDLWIFGARTQVSGVPVGDGNSLRLVLRGADGSGPRDNRYAHSSTPSMTHLGEGNRLEVVGSANAFGQNNQNFVPPPDPQFFSTLQ